jgi:hypothetical protein
METACIRRSPVESLPRNDDNDPTERNYIALKIGLSTNKGTCVSRELTTGVLSVVYSFQIDFPLRASRGLTVRLL